MPQLPAPRMARLFDCASLLALSFEHRPQEGRLGGSETYLLEVTRERMRACGQHFRCDAAYAGKVCSEGPTDMHKGHSLYLPPLQVGEDCYRQEMGQSTNQ